MRVFKKPKKEGEQHEWFAWRPVWAWDKDNRLGTVWLEKVWRTRNSSETLLKYSYQVIE